MKFNLDKILAGFGNVRAMERTHIDTHTEDRIKNVKGNKIAESEYGQIWANFQDLGGFDFLNISIISGTNINSKNGCKLILSNSNDNLEIDSDNEKVESDFSNVSNRYLTKLSFIVTKENIKSINNNEFDNIELRYKKKIMPLKMIK